MKRFFIITLSLVLLIATVFFAGYRWWSENKEAVSADTTSKRILIPKGTSAESIASKLYKEGLIKNPLAFKIYVQLTDRAGNIQSGEFTLSPNLTMQQVVEKLLKGPDELWVTIPEGLRREEVVERFVEVLEMDAERATTFRSEFLSRTNGQEGYLFPDTYLFPKEVTVDKIVGTLTTTFTEKTKDLEGPSLNKYSLAQVLTLASLVEKETKTKEERPVVAGILLKRFEAGWPLELDATVQYVLATFRCKVGTDCKWWPVTTVEDRKTVSAYNTYLNTGLPPAPIANPGLSSIEAVTNPEESDYWFYLHGADGVIRYAKTNSEHNQNIQKYLRF